ncbi:nicotinate-nucleotide--dimethylbenzimidazole phosphoribosyltransferase [Gordonia sp. ABSL1-1]|uniref:nicotinate-nucleotide--dimethylbenzimidazole phosphoribosyltransferase n=1 Tax=Gordonia sp. ABSL1-1 TaxID=3053923 RepID=UPI0025729794|nr:nicotinate-nucleotide--dimethylbenzimidazole phosphoribosyltransferase [Gordonia sp. ABSL1-1]MDL9937354.1 nicotinate-nucleotide--dimethylbenzimidazole phosphoribosyltransferase [Gordonia sp. ABSL1-1]
MATATTRTLLLGGVRSGKSALGEELLSAYPRVRYLATGPTISTDAEWVARVAAHRARRDARYETVETTDLAAALRAAPGVPALVDDLGNWLAARIDAAGGWDRPVDLTADVDDLCAALASATADVVLISPEVGLSLVPDTRSGRLFQDQLGALNSAVARVCERVRLVVAGRVLDLPASPGQPAQPAESGAAAAGPAIPLIAAAPAIDTPAPTVAVPATTSAVPTIDPTDAEVFGVVELPDETTARAARARHLTLTKPPGSLGRLEDIGVWIASCQRQCPPAPIRQPAVVVFAGDHGVAHAGVSAFPPEVTAQMVANIAGGGAAVNVMAREYGASVRVVDISVDADTAPEVSAYKVRRGSNDLRVTDSISLAEARQALAAGRAIADDLVDSGTDLLIAGEMGIGNTTPATVLVGAITRREPVEIVGRGTGIDDAGWMRKTAAIRDGMRRARSVAHDPLALLAAVGGADLTAVAGFLAQAAIRRTPVILDGVVITAAALVANELAPGASRWWLAGHRSVEPAHRLSLEHLDLDPVLDLSMRLGEGSGALMAVPVVRAAVDILNDMATFGEAGVSDSAGPDGDSETP